MAEVTIQGLEEILDNLSKLDAKMQQKTFRKAVRDGAKVIKATAVADAPVLSGLLRDNIKIRSSSKVSKGIFKASTGVGKKDWTGEAFYASFVLWGHKAGSRKLGNNRKEVKGNDFLKRAAETSGQAAAEAMIETIKQGIESNS